MSDVWATIAAERRALADLLGDIDAGAWDAPSRCGDWRVKDVVAHLVWLAEASNRSMLGDAFRARTTFNGAVDRMARRIADSTAPDVLVDRLRVGAGGRWVMAGMPAALALGEVLVHRADLTEAAGLPPHPADEAMRAVVEAERRVWFAFGVSRQVRTLRFAPTDGDWTVGPADGPLVEGPGEQLLLAIGGRPGATAGLTGPGLRLLG